MKITFVIPHDSLAGGVRVVSIYADRLQRRGHAVTIVSAPLPPLPFKQRLKSFLQLKLDHNSNSPSYLAALPVQHYRLDRYRPLRNEDLPDADVVIATWWETAEWVAPLSPSKGVKVYFVQHHEVFDYLPQERVQATYRLPFFHITIAQWLVDILRDRYQATAVALVPNGVDLEQFYSPPRVKPVLPTVGFVYSTTPWKGCDIALAALTKVSRQLPNLRLVAFGLEPPTDSLPLPATAQYGLQPCQATLKHWYTQCDAWLFSSRVEGFGLPILEAMACRTPVIATPAGAAPDLLKAGGGLLLAEANSGLMADAIQSLCTMNPKQWQHVSEQAYQTACHYSWDDATQQFEAALYRALARIPQN